jgi:hypothetical protein
VQKPIFTPQTIQYSACRLLVLAAYAAFFAALPVDAQQPFFTDDADVALRHHWHLEMSNEYDILPHSSLPSLRQDTQTVKFSFGPFENCEVGMDFPLIAIFNSQSSGIENPFGLGDTDYSIKYNFHKEKEGSRWPAITGSLNIEPPTGNTKLKLGSGLTDYYLNSIFQKTLSPKNTLRINAGATFAGNTATGVVGILTRGTIVTGGTSFVRQLTTKLDLGLEIYGGHTINADLGRDALQEQIGGNYEVSKGLTIDFGAVLGQAVGNTHYGFQIGFSKDF